MTAEERTAYFSEEFQKVQDRFPEHFKNHPITYYYSLVEGVPNRTPDFYVLPISIQNLMTTIVEKAPDKMNF